VTALLERVPVDQITDQAHQVRFGETLLRLFAFLGIMLGRALGYAWLAPVWFFAAVRVGWRDVHPPKVSDGRPGAR
jgi:uncharacterized protein (DUF58 family)